MLPVPVVHCELPAVIQARPVPVVDRTYPDVGVEPEIEMDVTFRVDTFAVAIFATYKFDIP
jgi:hypothetical protein